MDHAKVGIQAHDLGVRSRTNPPTPTHMHARMHARTHVRTHAHTHTRTHPGMEGQRLASKLMELVCAVAVAYGATYILTSAAPDGVPVGFMQVIHYTPHTYLHT